MSDTLLSAVALLLIAEGLLPFLSPNKMRSYMQSLIQMNDGTIRTVGLLSMSVGLVLLYIV